MSLSDRLSLEHRVQLEHFAKHNERIVYLCTRLMKAGNRAEYAFAVTVNSKGGVLGSPKLHALKYRSSRHYTLKKTWDISFLRKIERKNLKRNSLDLVFFFNDLKSSEWTLSTQKSSYVLLWVMFEISKCYASFVPAAVNLDMDYIESIGFKWIKDELVQSASDLQKQLVLNSIITLREKREREHEALEESFIQLPPISAEEVTDIEYYLSESKLSMHQPDELRVYLEKQLEKLNMSNITTLLSLSESKQQIVDSFVSVQTDLALLASSTSKYDEELGRMKQAVQQIESKNEQLEVSAKNQELLAKTLSELLDSIEISPKLEHELLNPCFSSIDDVKNTADEFYEMKKRIHNMDASLLKMAAVLEKMLEIDVIQATFIKNSHSFLIEQFENAAASINNINSSLTSEGHSDIHVELSVFEEFAVSLRRLDPISFKTLRSSYASIFHSVFQKQVKALLLSFKSEISSSLHNRDTRMSAFPELPINVVLAHSSSATLTVESLGGSHLGSRHTPLIPKKGKSFYTAFIELVTTIIQAILIEQQFCLEFFCEDDNYGDASLAEAQLLLGVMFAGCDEELKGITLISDKIDHMSTLSVLCEVENLSKKFGPQSKFVETLLSNLWTQLMFLFSTYITEQVKWIEHYRVPAKGAGVIAPLAKFPAFVESLENAIHNFRSDSCDWAYRKLAESLMQLTKNIAATNSKYNDVVLFQNNHYFWIVFSNRIPKISSLEPFVSEAFNRYKEHLASYLDWNMSYEDELRSLIKFWDNFDERLRSMDHQDIQFIEGLHKQDLKSLFKLSLTLKKLSAGIAGMFKRISRHIGKGDLFIDVWTQLENRFIERFVHFDAAVSDCYQTHERIPVAITDIVPLFRFYTGGIDASVAESNE